MAATSPDAHRRIAYRGTTLLCALLLAATPLAAQTPPVAPQSDAPQSADTIRWPLTWQAGDRWVYETESVDREIDDGKPRAMRTTDRTEIRVEEAGEQGYAQTWTTRDSRVETLEGDRGNSDMLAPLLDRFDGHGVVVEFGADGRYRRMRNLEQTTTLIRDAMTPVFERGMQAPLSAAEGTLDNTEIAAVRELVKLQMDAMLGIFFNPNRVENMTTVQMRTFTRHVGGAFEPGKRYRDAEPLRSPLTGAALPATREYVVTVDRDDPGLARLQWTHALDTGGDAAALWQLASEFENGGVEPVRGDAKGKPRDLVLREEGFALFRRDTGIIELLQTDTTSRYRELHDERERNRARLVGAARTWAQEEAAAQR